MRRAILLLATFGLALPGCYSRSRCDNGDVTLYWHFPSGSSELSCNQAGVLNVQVSIDGVVEGQFPCSSLSADGRTTVQGITITNFFEEPHSFLIDALDGNDRAVWSSDSFSYTPTACTNNVLDRNLTAITGDLTVGYQFTDTSSCTSNNSFIWYELRDANNQVVDAVGPTSQDPQAIPCASTITLQALPYGQYTVTRIQEVQFPSPSTYVTSHATCSSQPFGHFQPGEVQTVFVPPSTGTCF